MIADRAFVSGYEQVKDDNRKSRGVRHNVNQYVLLFSVLALRKMLHDVRHVNQCVLLFIYDLVKKDDTNDWFCVFLVIEHPNTIDSKIFFSSRLCVSHQTAERFTRTRIQIASRRLMQRAILIVL